MRPCGHRSLHHGIRVVSGLHGGSSATAPVAGPAVAAELEAAGGAGARHRGAADFQGTFVDHLLPVAVVAGRLALMQGIFVALHLLETRGGFSIVLIRKRGIQQKASILFGRHSARSGAAFLTAIFTLQEIIRTGPGGGAQAQEMPDTQTLSSTSAKRYCARSIFLPW